MRLYREQQRILACNGKYKFIPQGTETLLALQHSNTSPYGYSYTLQQLHISKPNPTTRLLLGALHGHSCYGCLLSTDFLVPFGFVVQTPLSSSFPQGFP
jgi:hypothetical protein